MTHDTPRARKLAPAARAASSDRVPDDLARDLREGRVRARDNPTAYQGPVDVLAVDQDAWTATVRYAPTAAPTTVDVEDLRVTWPADRRPHPGRASPLGTSEDGNCMQLP